MKKIIWIVRISTGLLFIFSGIVKAIDPQGLAYKMQEFFEAWSHAGVAEGLLSTLNNYALPVAIFIITLEVAVGVALIVGFRAKLTSAVVLLLMAFFTFLTAYVLYSGKVKACGCFGDCIPLTPMQTFIKDLILLAFALILFIKNKLITNLSTAIVRSLIVLLTVLCTLFVQFYVLKYLPIIDCLPFKKGNDIAALRKMPANAIQDEFAMSFVYEKDKVKKEFVMPDFPDSSWTFVERKQKLIKAGSNNLPLINDFTLVDANETDVTDSILSSGRNYLLLFIKELPASNASWDEQVRRITQNKARPVYVVTSQRNQIESLLKKLNLKVTAIFVTDGTAIKTAARVNPTILEMEGSLIKEKVSWPNFSKIQ